MRIFISILVYIHGKLQLVADALFCVQFTPPPPPPFAAATPVPGSAPPVRFFSSSYGQLERLTGKCFFYSQPVTMPDIPSFAGFNLGSSRSPAKGGGGKSRSNSRSNSNRQTASNRRYVYFLIHVYMGN